MKLPEKFQKNSILICAACSLVILAGFGLYMNYAKGAATLYWADIEGSSDVLNGIKIEGLVGDETHTSYVSIENGEVNNTFTLEAIHDVDGSNYGKDNVLNGAFSVLPSIAGNTKTTVEILDNPRIVFDDSQNIFPEDKGMKFTVETDSVDVYADITTGFPKNDKMSTDVNYMRLHTGLYVDKAHHEQKNIVLKAKGVANNQYSHIDISGTDDFVTPEGGELPWVKIGDKYYFTIPNNENFSGINNIYRIDGFEDQPPDPPKTDLEKYLYAMMFDSREYGKFTKIVDIPLAGNVQVFDLETVDDKLILLKGEGDRMVLELYDKNGKHLDRLEMPEPVDTLRLAECNAQVFKIGDTSGINIEYWHCRGNDITALEEGRYASIAITDSFKLNYYFKEFENNMNHAVQYNGKLFLLSESVDHLHPQLLITQYSSLNLFAYEPTEDLKGKLIYEGKLMTDIADDAKRQLIDQENSKPYEYRVPYQTDNFFAPGYKSDRRSYSSFTIKESGTDD